MAAYKLLAALAVIACCGLATCAAYRDARLPEVNVSDADLFNFIKWMRDHDTNRAHSGAVRVSFQNHTSNRNNRDDSKYKLFSHVEPTLLDRPTYVAMAAIFDNYLRATGRPEVGSRAERAEEDRFVEAVMQTEVGRQTYLFLHRHRHPYARNGQVYRAKLRQLWFDFYSRARGQLDTSGFEHVFVGETTSNEVQGMHSWLRFYLLERDIDERFDYKGYLVKRFHTLGAVKFGWGPAWKRSSSFFIGTSPEFDFSLFTLCFLARFDKDNEHRACKFELDDCPFKVVSHALYQRGVAHVGSAYPHADGRTCNRPRQQQHGRRRNHNDNRRRGGGRGRHGGS